MKKETNKKSKKDKKNKKGMGKKIAILAVFLVVVALFFILKGKGFGLASGTGDGTGENVTNTNTPSSQQEGAKETPKEDSLENVSEIVVSIKEDKVWLGNKEIADKEALKSCLESINDDTKTYKLEQENAILSTYNWVTEVFDALEIELQEVR